MCIRRFGNCNRLSVVMMLMFAINCQCKNTAIILVATRIEILQGIYLNICSFFQLFRMVDSFNDRIVFLI